MSFQPQTGISQLFILFTPKVTSLTLVLIISSLVYCHYLLDEPLPLCLNPEPQFFQIY